jgi:hypothetical protein
MTTRTFVSTMLVALALLWTGYTTLAQSRRDAAAPASSRRCVGVATATLRTGDPVITRIYRAYDDGTIETYDDGALDAKWTAIK